LADIPVMVSPGRLADQTGLSREEAAAFIERAAPLLRPVGKFDRVDDPARLLAEVPSLSPEDLSETAILAGLSLGPELAEAAADLAEPAGAFQTFTAIALRDALDYLEYRVRLFLKPSELAPCGRLSPDGQGLPPAAGPLLAQTLGLDDLPGLTLRADGGIDPHTGAIILFTTRPQSRAEGCEHCSRLNCPSRRQA